MHLELSTVPSGPSPPVTYAPARETGGRTAQAFGQHVERSLYVCIHMAGQGQDAVLLRVEEIGRLPALAHQAGSLLALDNRGQPPARASLAPAVPRGLKPLAKDRLKKTTARIGGGCNSRPEMAIAYDP